MKNTLITKANILIEASYKLSTQEQRVVMLLASMISLADSEFKDYILSIKAFGRLLGANHKDCYRQVREVTKRLIGRVFSIQTPGEELQMSWLSSAHYVKGQGQVRLKFDPCLKPFLLQLKERFTSYSLRHVIQLRSSFSIRLYELLKQYENIGERIFNIDDLKMKLGIDKAQYQLYGHFKAKVLNVALKEVNDKTDITFGFEEIKIGRGVGKIRFIIKTKSLEALRQIEVLGETTDTPESPAEPPSEEETLVGLLPEKYRKSISIRKLLLRYLATSGLDYVARNIEYANAKSNAVNANIAIGKGSNYRNYLALALRADFGLPFKEDMETAKTDQEASRRREAALAAIRNTGQEEARVGQENMDRARIFQQNLAPEALAQLREEAFDSLDDQQKSLVLRKIPGSEMLLKIAMTKVCMTRMHISPTELPENEKATETTA